MDKIAQSTSLPDCSPVTSDVKAMIRETFGGTMHGEVKPACVLPLKVKVKVGLLGCDPPDIATRKIVLRA